MYILIPRAINRKLQKYYFKNSIDNFKWKPKNKSNTSKEVKKE